MAAFHYAVKAKLIRYKSADEINFLEIEEEFKNESPIIARDAAFNFYQNYIDVLLQARGLKYISDKQTREELNSFIETETKTLIKFNEKEFEFDDSIGNGIGIFLIVDTPKDESHDLLSLKKNEEVFIHGIGKLIGGLFDTNSLIHNLNQEFELYNYYHYETKGKKKEIIYCNSDEWEEGYTEDEPSSYEILETPFDWTGYDKPYWWVEPEDEEVEATQQAPKTLEGIIQEGESNQVEFKPTLLYNFSTGKGGIGVKGIIAKAICAFLNSNGGFLIIGVNDKGEPQGLSFDFSLSEDKSQKDFFMLEFDQMLEHFLSFSIKSNVSGQFYKLNEKDIFVVTVTPSKRRPIFLKGQNGKEFYVRGEASSRQLIDIEELVNYCIEKWSC